MEASDVPKRWQVHASISGALHLQQPRPQLLITRRCLWGQTYSRSRPPGSRITHLRHRATHWILVVLKRYRQACRLTSQNAKDCMTILIRHLETSSRNQEWPPSLEPSLPSVVSWWKSPTCITQMKMLCCLRRESNLRWRQGLWQGISWFQQSRYYTRILKYSRKFSNLASFMFCEICFFPCAFT